MTLVVVESVVNNPGSVGTVSLVRVLNNELFPAFVYPAKEIMVNPSSVLRLRWRWRFSRIFFNFSCTTRARRLTVS